MSARHNVKCSLQEATEFRKKVKTFLDSEKLAYTKIVALRCYDGQVKVFTGGTQNKLRLRMGRKLVAFHTPNGTIEGENDEAIAELKLRGGSQLWLKTNEPIEEPEYLPVYRAVDWEEEKQYLKEKLLERRP